VGGVAAGVILGPNMTTLTYAIARTLARTWQPGDELVVSRLDHDANVRPWIQVAEQAGVLVRWAEVDIETGELPAWQYDELLTERTRLVAVTAASNAIGTRPDVAAIAARAHDVGALVYVDGVHAAPHGLLDRTAMGADFLAVSAYKWCGPHVGAVIADPALLEQLRPDKLVPAPDKVPERFETGTPPFELLAGVPAAVDHLASICGEAAGSRRERLRASMAAVADYEGRLFGWLDDALRAMRHVQVVGCPENPTPTLSFTVANMTPPAGDRGAVPPRDLRVGRRLLRPRAVRRARRQRAGRRGAARAAALQHRRGGRLRDRLGGRAAAALTRPAAA
jgi:cysteine desulfurase family protein (TIGR01976 family)